MKLQILKFNFDRTFLLFDRKILNDNLSLTSKFALVVNESKECFIGHVEKIDQQVIIKKVSENQNIDSVLKDSESHLANSNKLIDVSINDLKTLDIYIGSLKEALLITEWANFRSQKQLLFRGQANKKWKIESSLFRFGYEMGKESKMYSEIQHMNHKKFAQKDFLLLASEMQHYGIPTRLVDWTGNIFNAIYFACVNTKENLENDGVVFLVHNCEIIESDTETYKNIESFLKYRYTTNTTSKYSVEVASKQLFPILEDIYFTKEKYKFFKTKLSHERIKRQDGYFSVCFETDSAETSSFLQHTVKKYIERKKIKIDEKTLSNLVGTLESPLTNENLTSFLFSINTFNKEFKIDKNDLKEALMRYQRIQPILHSMNDIQSNENLLKIIIPAKFKENIINELNNVGVNSSTIYPDLEGMTKYINEKYAP